MLSTAASLRSKEFSPVAIERTDANGCELPPRQHSFNFYKPASISLPRIFMYPHTKAVSNSFLTFQFYITLHHVGRVFLFFTFEYGLASASRNADYV